ncbi:hypothetical protein NX905_29220, partial [Burkholderia thailandensis]|nr:hypothetical protein [Burkholderia thailandensis]
VSSSTPRLPWSASYKSRFTANLGSPQFVFFFGAFSFRLLCLIFSFYLSLAYSAASLCLPSYSSPSARVFLGYTGASPAVITHATSALCVDAE